MAIDHQGIELASPGPSEHTQASVAIRGHRDWFERIFDHTVVSIAAVNVQGRFLQVNAAHERMMGFSKEELRALTYLDITHPDDRPYSQAQVARLLSGEAEAFVIDKRYVRKDGRPVWGRESATLMAPSATEPAAVVLIIEDISERRQAEEARCKSWAAVRVTANAAGALVWVSSASGESLFLSEQWYEFTGQTSEQARGLGWVNAVHPEDKARLRPCWQRCRETGEPYEGEIRYRRNDGQYRWHAFRALPGRDANGCIEAWYGVSIDVDDRKHAEQDNRQLLAEARGTIEQLHRAQARLRLAQAAAGVGTWEYDPASKQMHFSPECLDLFEIDPHEPDVYAAWLRGVHPDDTDTVQSAIDRCLMDGEVDVEYRYRHRLRGERWMQRKGKLLADRDGRPFVAGVSFDVTERRRLVEQLHEADRRKDEFLAMLAHELRNPLAPLVNAHRLLARTAALTEESQAPLAMAERQTRQLTRLVDDLLEVSRITRGKITLRPEPMSVTAAVAAAVESLAPTFEQRDQHITLALPPRPVRIVADPARVAQILENLLNNASKYTPHGGSIRVKVEECASAVKLRVRDTGIGIEPGKIPQLFELFSQIDATLDRAQGGLGIGLALVKRLAELHGGSVSAKSEGLGKGAAFTVRLPRMAHTAAKACTKPGGGAKGDA